MLRLRKRHLPFIALLCGVIVAMLPSLASSATTASVEALNEGGGLYGETHRWSPAQVAVTTAANAGKVTFANNSSLVPHGIVWKSAPATPVCEEGAGKVPVGVGHSGYSWSGACTFSQEGTYSYYCSVHGEAMSGTVYVNANGTLPPLATTGAAGEETEIAATLHGTVNPEGQPTSYYFNYGTTLAYGHKTTELSVGSDSSNHPLSAAIGELLPGTTYHFQIVAVYESGASTTLGGDRTFRTASPPGQEEETTTTTTTTTTSTSQTQPPPTTTTTTTATTTPPPPGSGSGSGASLGASGGSPLAGSASAALKLASAQHGSAIHGTLAIAPAGTGARLEVDLLSPSAVLARSRGHARQVRIGRLVRGSLVPGNVSFSVPLDAQAKRALTRRHRLPVIVQITITPANGKVVTLTRSVTLRH